MKERPASRRAVRSITSSRSRNLVESQSPPPLVGTGCRASAASLEALGDLRQAAACLARHASPRVEVFVIFLLMSSGANLATKAVLVERARTAIPSSLDHINS